MSKIKEIYVDGSLRTDFKTSALYIDGQEIKTNTKFNIFNRRVLDLNQNSDFTILYTLQVLKDEKRDQAEQNDPLNGIQIKEPSLAEVADANEIDDIRDLNEAAESNDPLNGIQIKDPKRLSTGTDPLNGIQIKEPTKNKSSITINGTSSSDTSTFVRINGNLVTDQSRIELFLDGKKVKNANLTIVIEIKKDDLLKYVRLKKR
jgi:hypothetical protein